MEGGSDSDSSVSVFDPFMSKHTTQEGEEGDEEA